MSTLGERICAVRTAQGLSQQELAEQLDVSRQSISKWETDTSVPELDKLVKLCDLFHLTLDQLVRGRSSDKEETSVTVDAVPEQTPPASTESVRKPSAVQRIVGVVLLLFGLIPLLLILLFVGPDGLLAILTLSLPLFVCGCVLLVVPRHAGLVCGWVLWGMIAIYLYCTTGIRPWWIFGPWLYRPELWTHAIIAWCEVVPLVILTAVTVRLLLRYRRNHPETI